MERFSSKFQFSDSERELMVTDVGELTSRLKKKGVLAFDKENTIRLLDKDHTEIRYRQELREEVRRFATLFSESLKGLNYLVQNLTFSNEVQETVRTDRIVGAIDYPKTTQLFQSGSGERMVACLEIRRNYATPETKLLALTLLAIVSYCNRQLSADHSKEDSLDQKTVEQLRAIQSYAGVLLQSRRLREIIPYAIAEVENLDELFHEMLTRVQYGKTPSYYLKILDLFTQWKYFLWVMSTQLELKGRALRMYFLTPKNENKLFECWTCYKILSILSEQEEMRETKQTDGAATFESSSKVMSITYQRKFDSPWVSNNTPLLDYPDITIDTSNGKRIVLDAKNSRYIPSKFPYPYRVRMESYLISTHAKLGILVHSRSAQKDERVIESGDSKIKWVRMSPASAVEDEGNMKKLLCDITQASM